jgi:hypothetical protein
LNIPFKRQGSHTVEYLEYEENGNRILIFWNGWNHYKALDSALINVKRYAGGNSSGKPTSSPHK